MTITPSLTDDPSERQQLLEDLLRRNNELRQQAEIAQQQAQSAEQQAADARRRIDELERVLDQTAAEYDQLKEQHAELAETLALLRRYIFGQRRERFTDDPGQGHLFDIPEILDEPEPAASPSADEAAAQRSTAARSPRRTRLDHLPHIRIPHDVPEEEKTCSCCGGPKTRIGEDESRELDFIPARLEVKVHVLPCVFTHGKSLNFVRLRHALDNGAGTRENQGPWMNRCRRGEGWGHGKRSGVPRGVSK
jgi:multidrug efflux pump subunit AcrA (membrane-fusion protein)